RLDHRAGRGHLRDLRDAEGGDCLRRRARASARRHRVEAGRGDGGAFVTAAERIRSDTDLLARVLDEVTVKETFFDREHGQLDSIDWHLLLCNAKARRSQTIDVWTAGCATGEE